MEDYLIGGGVEEAGGAGVEEGRVGDDGGEGWGWGGGGVGVGVWGGGVGGSCGCWDCEEDGGEKGCEGEWEMHYF